MNTIYLSVAILLFLSCSSDIKEKVVFVVVVVVSDYSRYLKTEKEIPKSLRKGKLYSIEASNEA
jgi:hypothetical protein